MTQNPLDQRLARLFERRPDADKMIRLEHDVWQKIHVFNSTWQQKIISVFNIPQFQTSALAFAFIFGISLSSLSLFDILLNYTNNQNVFDMSIFSPDSRYLAVNLIGK